MYMRIMTFNILADVFVEPNKAFMDRWYPTLKYEDLLMKHRFHTLIKYIKGDVILLQEVTPHVRKRLCDIFGCDYIILPLSCHRTAKNITGNLTILRKNAFTNIKHATIYVGDVAIGVTEADGVDIYNIHLDDTSTAKRRGELEHIISTFDPTNKIIIGGDFNTNEKSLHNMLTRADFTMNIPTKGTCLCEEAMIDYIYVRGFSHSIGHVNNSISSTNCYQDTIRKYGSDHHPVSVVARR
jgi:hypothetical protein